MRNKWIAGAPDSSRIRPSGQPYQNPPFMEPENQPNGPYIRPPYAPNERPFPAHPRPDEWGVGPVFDPAVDVDPRRLG